MFSKFRYPISSLPITKGIILSRLDSSTTEPDIEEMSRMPYRSILGCLSFIASRTRPDLNYAINILAQFQENPGMRHWNVLLKLLGYVCHTKNYALCLSDIEDLVLTCYSDSDFASNRDDRISLGGMLIFIDRVPIAWRTFKHKCVSLSSMEAEYISLSESAKEIIWIQNIIAECSQLGINLESSTILCDNQAALSFAKSPIEINISMSNFTLLEIM